MKAPRGEWRKSDDIHVGGKAYWLGSVNVGGVFALKYLGDGASRSQASVVRLPDVTGRASRGDHVTEAEAMEAVERRVADWFARLSEA